MKHFQVLLKATYIALLVGGLHFGTQTHAAYAACSGHGCDGQLPNNQQSCVADARTLGQTIFADSLIVDLRYSPTCLSRWARTTYDKTPPSGGEWYRSYVNWYPYSSYYDTPSIAVNYGQQIFSPMRGIDAAKGCGQRVNNLRAAVCTNPA